MLGAWCGDMMPPTRTGYGQGKLSCLCHEIGCLNSSSKCS